MNDDQASEEWLAMPSGNVEYRLTQLMRVPRPIAKAIGVRLNSIDYLKVDVDFLKRRIEYLEQHVPEHIRNPPQTVDTTRFTGD